MHTYSKLLFNVCAVIVTDKWELKMMKLSNGLCIKSWQ